MKCDKYGTTTFDTLASFYYDAFIIVVFVMGGQDLENQV